MHVVLVQPEIAPNTGNIIRLCANTGTSLHLVEPLGFSLDDRLLRRAGLDYHELTTLRTHPSLRSVSEALAGRWFAFSAGATRRYSDIAYQRGDVLVFGAERAGLEPSVLRRFASDRQLAIPMRPGNRSMNLANAVGVVVYEAWRQQGFQGAAPTGDLGAGLTSEHLSAPPFDC